MVEIINIIIDKLNKYLVNFEPKFNVEKRKIYVNKSNYDSYRLTINYYVDGYYFKEIKRFEIIFDDFHEEIAVSNNYNNNFKYFKKIKFNSLIDYILIEVFEKNNIDLIENL